MFSPYDRQILRRNCSFWRSTGQPMLCRSCIFPAYESHIRIECAKFSNEMFPNRLQAPTPNLPNWTQALMCSFRPPAKSTIQDDLQFPGSRIHGDACDFGDLSKFYRKLLDFSIETIKTIVFDTILQVMSKMKIFFFIYRIVHHHYGGDDDSFLSCFCFLVACKMEKMLLKSNKLIKIHFLVVQSAFLLCFQLAYKWLLTTGRFRIVICQK